MFRADIRTQDAVIRNLEIIGEAAGRVSPGLVALYRDVPWEQLRGLRNRPVHVYFDIDLAIVWRVVEHELPLLADQVAAMLAADDAREGLGGWSGSRPMTTRRRRRPGAAGVPRRRPCGPGTAPPRVRGRGGRPAAAPGAHPAGARPRPTGATATEAVEVGASSRPRRTRRRRSSRPRGAAVRIRTSVSGAAPGGVTRGGDRLKSARIGPLYASRLPIPFTPVFWRMLPRGPHGVAEPRPSD